ncbi:MAG: tetratricopeptide repeat protein [Rikenellaceae bacterium]|nr:tetratricopeptide repeat protein [Rikenellaceae bacterium]
MIDKYFVLALFWVFLSGCTDYYVKQAEHLEDSGLFEDAILVWDKVLQRDPEHISALINRGVDKSILGDYRGATEDYTRVIAVDSAMVLAWFNRGLIKSRLNDFVGAVEDFNKAKELKSPGAGKFAVIIERHDDEVAYFEIILERGRAYMNMDSLVRAYSDFTTCIEHGYYPFESRYLRGLILLQAGIKEEAYEDFSHIVRFGSASLHYVQEAKKILETYF